MRVLFLSDSPTVSGAELVMLSHVRALTYAGGAAHVVLRASNRRLADRLEEWRIPYTACSTFSAGALRTTANGVALAHFAASFRRTASLLRDVIGDLRPDVMHCVSYPAVLYGVLAARGSTLPVLWHEHNIKRLHWANRRIIRAVGRRCRRVLGPSRAVTANLARAGIDEQRLRTVYNGVDLMLFAPTADAAASARRALGLRAETRAVALPGQLLPYKGHGLLIEAAPALLRRFGDLRFFFVGALENRPYQAELERHLDRVGLRDRFYFTGWRPDIHSILQAMDVIVVPTTRAEPAALTLIEAMALGLPVVATRTGGTPELVLEGETALLVEPGNSDELAEAIGRVLGDVELARRFGLAGRRRVEEHFTMPAHQAAILRLYQEVVAEAS